METLTPEFLSLLLEGQQDSQKFDWKNKAPDVIIAQRDENTRMHVQVVTVEGVHLKLTDVMLLTVNGKCVVNDFQQL